MEIPRAEQRLPGVVDPVSGLVVIDLSCRRCGYNLRTLAEAGRCPECGSPVGLSTRGNFLQFADPDWVARDNLLSAACGWRPETPLKEGFAKTACWYQEHGLL